MYPRAEKMGSSKNKVPVVKVVLRLPRYQVPLVVTRARLIFTRMTGNPWFPQAGPLLAELGPAIDALHEAQVTTLTGVVGGVSARNKKRRDLVSVLERLAMHVEIIANANLENAFAIVESAAMFVKNTRGRSPVVYHAEPTGRRGEVRVVAPSAGDRAGYEFQYSLDGGATWLPFDPPFSNQATVTLSGLTPGSIVHFRYRVTIKGVTGKWSGKIWIEVE